MSDTERHIQAAIDAATEKERARCMRIVTTTKEDLSGASGYALQTRTGQEWIEGTRCAMLKAIRENEAAVLAPGSVDSPRLADGAVQQNVLAAGSITPGIIEAGKVTAPEDLEDLEGALFAALNRPAPPPLSRVEDQNKQAAHRRDDPAPEPK